MSLITNLTFNSGINFQFLQSIRKASDPKNSGSVLGSASQTPPVLSVFILKNEAEKAHTTKIFDL